MNALCGFPGWGLIPPLPSDRMIAAVSPLCTPAAVCMTRNGLCPNPEMKKVVVNALALVLPPPLPGHIPCCDTFDYVDEKPKKQEVRGMHPIVSLPLRGERRSLS